LNNKQKLNHDSKQTRVEMMGSTWCNVWSCELLYCHNFEHCSHSML